MRSPVARDKNLVRVARIGKPHGIRGEVTVEVFSDSPETRFAEGQELILGGAGETGPDFTELTVAKSRWNKKILLLKFAEFSDRDTAESLRGAELYVAAEDPLKDNEGWYADDLVGLTVHEGSIKAAKVGEVTDLIIRTAQDLLEVRLIDGHIVFIPFVEEIVPEIDEERGAIVITPPPGLLELNQD